jgi:hypothetical protein
MKTIEELRRHNCAQRSCARISRIAFQSHYKESGLRLRAQDMEQTVVDPA